MQSSRWANAPASKPTSLPQPTPTATQPTTDAATNNTSDLLPNNTTTAAEPTPAAPVEPAPPVSQSYDTSYDPAYDDIAADEFAQTRPPDDLFDDDFTPLETPAPAEVVAIPDHEPDEHQHQQQQQPKPQQHAQSKPQHQSRHAAKQAAHPPGDPVLNNAPKGPRGGGRGGRRAGQPRRGTSRAEAQGAAGAVVEQSTVESKTDVRNEVAETGAAEGTVPDSAAAQTPRREAAVRGDRSGTGGPKREKLTEKELTAKLEAMKIKNASLMEKHERSQADADHFNEREAQAAQRRAEDRVNRQAMMGEREKNRQRKLKSQGGREWDLEKDDKDFSAQGDRRARRGAFGGVAGERQGAQNGEADASDLPGTPSRGGGRGRGRGRGGRGGYNDRKEQGEPRNQQKQAPPKADDFPDLPASEKKADKTTEEKPITLEFPNKKTNLSVDTSEPPAEKKSWADQVESAVTPS